ncbi:MAG: sporulation protein YqfD [Anaerosacchariphilus sp.]
MFHGSRTFPLYTTVETEHPLHLTGNFYLPLSFGLIERAEYEVYTEKYTAEEAKGLAEAHLNEFLNNLLQKGVQIVGNDVKIDNGRNFCVSKGKIEALEEIGIPKIRQKEQAAFE